MVKRAEILLFGKPWAQQPLPDGLIVAGDYKAMIFEGYYCCRCDAEIDSCFTGELRLCDECAFNDAMDNI